MDYSEIAHIVQNAIAKDFEGYDIEKTLAYPLINYKKSKKLVFAVLMHPIRFGRYVASGSGKIAFFWGADYAKRKDHWEKFEGCMNLIENKVYIRERKSLQASFIHATQLWRILFWKRKLRVLPIAVEEQWYIAATLFQMKCEIMDLNALYKNLREPLELLICFCDAQKGDSIAVQFFKEKKVKSATLEHGYYDPSFILERLAYSNSLSDYFLCFGPVSKKHGIEMGLAEKKMIPLGMLESIRDADIRNEIRNTKRFGVALTYGTYDGENELMLHIANELAHSCDLTYIVRPHPHLKLEEYQSFIDFTVGKVAPNGQSIVNFEDSIDFCLLGNSAMFITMLYKRIPTYRCAKKGCPDKFSDALWCRCTNQHEAVSLYLSMIERPSAFMDRVNEIRENYFATGVVADNYRAFFLKFQ